MKKLPIGKQVYRTLIEDNFVYVDKTKYLVELAESGIATFLARPRRFGKSLTINTFKEMFLGSKELFKNTYAYENWNWGKTYPVIKLDMSVCVGNSPDIVMYKIIKKLENIAEEYSIELKEQTYPEIALIEIIRKLSKNSKVVILIDEYDAPILNTLYGDILSEIKKTLRNFYSVLKEQEENIQFVFITGISKFSKVGVFSTLNNLNDITLTKKYSKIVGCTKKEIIENFSEHIDSTKEELAISDDDFWRKLKHYYNGYSWDGKNFLYNPFSLLRFLNDRTFVPYWMESGSPSFIVNYAKQNNLDLHKLENKIVEPFFMAQSDIDEANPESFLTQAGYLTIKEVDEFGDYKLNFPNYEVRYTFNNLLLKSQYEIDSYDLLGVKRAIRRALIDSNTEAFLQQVKIIYSVIPSIYFSNNKNEYFYTTILLMFLIASGFDIVAEKYGNDGRMDLVLSWEKKVYILELKVDASAKSALKQIKANNYDGQFANFERILIGLKVDMDKKNVVDWIVEEDCKI